MNAVFQEIRKAFEDQARLEWLLSNHAANFECLENVAGNIERYNIPATREAIDNEMKMDAHTCNLNRAMDGTCFVCGSKI